MIFHPNQSYFRSCLRSSRQAHMNHCISLIACHLHCMYCFRTLLAHACRLGFFALVFFPLCLFHTCIAWFYVVFCPCFLSPLLVSHLHCVALLDAFSSCFLSPLLASYLHCVVLHSFPPSFCFPCACCTLALHGFCSAFCFIACICIRVVMLTVWSSYEPGYAPFGTLAA